jgi:hypothetical protein
MTTLTFPRVEAYLFSDASSPPTHRSLQRFAATEGVGSSDRVLASTQAFSAALDSIVAGLTTDLAGTYSWDMTSAGILTLTSTATWSIVWWYRLKYALGFTGSHAGAATYSGATVPLVCVPLLGVVSEPADDGSLVEVVKARHGRSFALHFCTTERWRVRALVRVEHVDAVVAGWCGRGRVRVYLTSTTTAQSPTDLGGFVDGYVYGLRWFPELERDGFVEIEWLLARALA